MNTVVCGSKVAKIRELNDRTRFTLKGAQIMLTSGVAALDDETKAQVLTVFRQFKDFDEGNDPHGEHDFVHFEVAGEKYFGKCDYYDTDIRYGSDDPSNPTVTKRVWTLMLAEEN